MQACTCAKHGSLSLSLSVSFSVSLSLCLSVSLSPSFCFFLSFYRSLCLNNISFIISLPLSVYLYVCFDETYTVHFVSESLSSSVYYPSHSLSQYISLFLQPSVFYMSLYYKMSLSLSPVNLPLKVIYQTDNFRQFLFVFLTRFQSIL